MIATRAGCASAPSVWRRLQCSIWAWEPLDPNVKNPGAWLSGSIVQVRLVAESLKCHGLLHSVAPDREQRSKTAHAGGASRFPAMADDRPALRRRLRAARRAVPAAERPGAAAAIDRAPASLGLPRPGSRISAFHPFDGEIDPSVALARARALGCSVYYPVITSLRARRMRFVASIEDAAADAISPALA